MPQEANNANFRGRDNRASCADAHRQPFRIVWATLRCTQSGRHSQHLSSPHYFLLRILRHSAGVNAPRIVAGTITH